MSKKQDNGTNVVSLDHFSVPDYTGDQGYAEILKKRIENFWKKEGYGHKVKVWLEQDNSRKGPPLYYVRSNIKYKVPQI